MTLVLVKLRINMKEHIICRVSLGPNEKGRERGREKSARMVTYDAWSREKEEERGERERKLIIRVHRESDLRRRRSAFPHAAAFPRFWFQVGERRYSHSRCARHRRR